MKIVFSTGRRPHMATAHDNGMRYGHDLSDRISVGTLLHTELSPNCFNDWLNVRVYDNSADIQTVGSCWCFFGSCSRNGRLFRRRSPLSNIFRNDSSNSVTGTIRLKTQNGTTSAETTIDLPSDSSMSLVVAKRPTATAIDIDRNSEQSIFNWTDIPSCRIGGLPTQTITINDDSIGVEYRCKRHDE